MDLGDRDYVRAVMAENIRRAQDIVEDSQLYLKNLSARCPSDGEMLGLTVVAQEIATSLTALLEHIK